MIRRTLSGDWIANREHVGYRIGAAGVIVAGLLLAPLPMTMALRTAAFWNIMLTGVTARRMRVVVVVGSRTG